eukprot:Em0005g269a
MMLPAVGEVDSIVDTPGSTWLLKIHVFPQIGVGLSGQAVRPAGLKPDPWLAYGNPVGHSRIAALHYEQIIDAELVVDTFARLHPRRLELDSLIVPT